MSKHKSLQQIFSELPLPFCKTDAPATSITGIAIDSRLIQPGYLYVAMKGRSLDGHDFISKAIANRAVAVVGERDLKHVITRPYIRLENTRRALTWIAASFYNWPSRKLTVIGVTGTDGKTTTTHLIYQILLAAWIATVYGLKIKPEIAAFGINALANIPGHMERIDMGQNFTIMVDFAHTPTSLGASLEAAREMLVRHPLIGPQTVMKRDKPKVIAVFGSAGLRDTVKRRLMAAISVELADLTVLTAEDPRSESLNKILEEMAVGARSKGGCEGETFWRISDRGEAIRFALSLAQRDDIVLVLGKGHEQSMCLGAREYQWDDRTAVRSALGELLNKSGPPMPYLPTQDTLEDEWLTWT